MLPQCRVTRPSRSHILAPKWKWNPDPVIRVAYRRDAWQNYVVFNIVSDPELSYGRKNFETLVLYFIIVV
jgi:hypothetical protein